MKDFYCIRNRINLIRIPFTIVNESTIKSFLVDMINISRSGRQVYVTYRHYYDEISKHHDMSNIYCVILDTPK